MSNPRVAALVCEGQTDVPILRAIVEELWPTLDEIRVLQPELDDTGRALRPAGWTQVKAWCEQHVADLEDVFQPLVGDPIDLLLVAVDLDIAIHAGIEDPPQSLGLYETTRLRRKVEGWLRSDTRTSLPAALVVSTPVMALEAWILAALDRKVSPEKIRDPVGWLVERGKLRLSPSDGKPWKELHRYRGWAPQVAKKLPSIRRRCKEADRTAKAIVARRKAVGR